jgi:molybdopterin-containing oxidoreductase family iron-sulfur binding subunit
MAGCPYGARSFNFVDPQAFVKEPNPRFPMRMRGVVEKCTFCSERLAKGDPPYCVEASEGGMLFGDLSDPASAVRKTLEQAITVRRKPSLGTQPGVYYIL